MPPPLQRQPKTEFDEGRSVEWNSGYSSRYRIPNGKKVGAGSNHSYNYDEGDKSSNQLTIRWNWIHVCRIVAKAE
jgi:hypothetical protein